MQYRLARKVLALCLCSTLNGVPGAEPTLTPLEPFYITAENRENFTEAKIIMAHCGILVTFLP